MARSKKVSKGKASPKETQMAQGKEGGSSEVTPTEKTTAVTTREPNQSSVRLKQVTYLWYIIPLFFVTSWASYALGVFLTDRQLSVVDWSGQLVDWERHVVSHWKWEGRGY